MTFRSNPFRIVEQFERQLEDYTGAPYAIAVDSCTNALGICFEYIMKQLDGKYNEAMDVTAHMPKHTYIGVPMQAKRAGMHLDFVEDDWQGAYPISFTYFNEDNVVCEYESIVIDSARRFRKDVWFENRHQEKWYDFMCVSFHKTKILGHTHGGAILTNWKDFVPWAKEMRFDGRKEGVRAKDDKPTVFGRHCYMMPEVAAALMHKMAYLPDYPADLKNDDYPDLSKLDIFK